MIFEVGKDNYGPIGTMLVSRVIETLQQSRDSFGIMDSTWQNIRREVQETHTRYYGYYLNLIEIECHHIVDLLDWQTIVRCWMEILDSSDYSSLQYYNKIIGITFELLDSVTSETEKPDIDLGEIKSEVQQTLIHRVLSEASSKRFIIRNEKNNYEILSKWFLKLAPDYRVKFEQFYSKIFVKTVNWVIQQLDKNNSTIWGTIIDFAKYGFDNEEWTLIIHIECAEILSELTTEEAILLWIGTSDYQEQQACDWLLDEIFTELVRKIVYAVYSRADEIVNSSDYQHQQKKTNKEITLNFDYGIEEIGLEIIKILHHSTASQFLNQTVWEAYCNSFINYSSPYGANYSPLIQKIIEIEINAKVESLEILDAFKLWSNIELIDPCLEKKLSLDTLKSDIIKNVEEFISHVARICRLQNITIREYCSQNKNSSGSVFISKEIPEFVKPIYDEVIQGLFKEFGRIAKKYFTTSTSFFSKEGMDRFKYEEVCAKAIEMIPRSFLGLIALTSEVRGGYEYIPDWGYPKSFYGNLWEHQYFSIEDITDRVSDMLQWKVYNEVSNRYNEWFEDESEDEDDRYIDEDFDEVDGIPQERYDFD